MDRIRKLKMNAITSLFNRIALIIHGFVLPRVILLYYGSEINGLVASITQFLSIITFLDLGVGTVVQSALYRPLVQKNNQQVSIIINAAKKYFRNIAYLLILYVIILMITYPFIANESLDFYSTGFLIFTLSIQLFSQYYFGIINEFLLNADQKEYVQLGSEIIPVLLNTILSVILITQGVSIQIVKLVGSLIFLIRPIYLSYYVNKHYNIQKDISSIEDPIPQKWNGMAQHIAWTVQKSNDVIILTLFSTLENISIYSIYNMVVFAINLLVASITSSLKSFFGNLIGSDEIELLKLYFARIEWLIHTGVTFLYGMTAVLITPFVIIYTSGVNDINYYAPLFSFFLVIAQAAFSIRSPYQSLIFSAGHFRQTQTSSIIEVIINIVISVLMVSKFGLVGVTFGTLLSMLYRTFYLVWYLSKNIINRSVFIFIKHVLVDIICFTVIFMIGQFVLNIIVVDSIFKWLIVALLLAIIFLSIIVIINLFFYKDTMYFVIRKVLKRT